MRRQNNKMPISYSKSTNRFVLTTKRTKYVFDISCGRQLTHVFYGKKMDDVPEFKNPKNCSGFEPEYEWAGGSRESVRFHEISFFGNGDFRPEALRLTGGDGTGVTDFRYRSHKTYAGKPSGDGLPTARAGEDTRTLEVTLEDGVSGCLLTLYYCVYCEEDVITRFWKLENAGDGSVKIEKSMSLCIDMPRKNMEMITLPGQYSRERAAYQRVPLVYGTQSQSSRRGATSHMANPFFCLCDKTATNERGEAYGFNLVYSGSFLTEVDLDQFDNVRIMSGLGGDCFSYTLEPQESFTCPEAVMTYSAHGIGGMSRNFHDFIRRYIMKPEYVDKRHPVVLNTWEACWFDINEKTLLDFADEAKKIGIDMLVMDDGWFGARNDDRAGLGDWRENRSKFPNGLKSFVDRVKAKGIDFGIWVEPEMVNPDSDLFRAHPDWCLRVPGREMLLGRNQCVLDMSNGEVVDYLKGLFSETFDGVDIDYFKWDMNRHITAAGSAALPASRQCEVPFRYMKGVYDLLAWFGEKFPNAVIETCSGGGGRYDLGMMCYGMQIWTSDNTDPYGRIPIQYSSMTAYPAATMSCHVSDPKENAASLDFRYKIAMGGMLGYELNILKTSQSVKETIRKQIAEYKASEHLMRLGDYYPLVSPFEKGYTAYYYASADGRELMLTVAPENGSGVKKTKKLRLSRALPNEIYTDRRSGKRYSGEELRDGLEFSFDGTKFEGELLWLVAE